MRAGCGQGLGERGRVGGVGMGGLQECELRSEYVTGAKRLRTDGATHCFLLGQGVTTPSGPNAPGSRPCCPPECAGMVWETRDACAEHTCARMSQQLKFPCICFQPLVPPDYAMDVVLPLLRSAATLTPPPPRADALTARALTLLAVVSVVRCYVTYPGQSHQGQLHSGQ